MRHLIKLTAVCLTAATLLAGTASAASREGLISEGEQALLDGNAIVAERAFIVGMDQFPGDQRFPYYAGVAAYILHRHGDASRRLVQATDDFPRAHFYLAMIALEDGRPEEALQQIDAYLERVPRDPEGELLKGLAKLKLADPDAVNHFNLAAQLDKKYLSVALFYRGLSQFEHNEQAGADKALRAVMRLGDQPALLKLAEQTLDVMKNRGDIARTWWGEAYIDTIYDDNLNREVAANRRGEGIRMLTRGRFWGTVMDEDPTITVGGWFAHDQPIAEIEEPITGRVSGRTGIGLFGDVGFYKPLEKLSLDPGIETELDLSMADVSGGYGLSRVDVVFRPRLYLFADHERSTKIFYELGVIADPATGFNSGIRNKFGVRPSWTGSNRRTYVSGLIAFENVSADADAFSYFGPVMVLDAQGDLGKGWILETTASYKKKFFRDVNPERDEDALLAHVGVGYWSRKKKVVTLVGTDQEVHLNTDDTRSWKARSYWLRLGAYL